MPSSSTSSFNPLLFALAGCSNMSGATVTNPIDVIKTRLQLDNELTAKSGAAKKYQGLFRGTARIVAEEGFLGLYKGWGASMLREGSYSTIRLGAYEPLKSKLGATDPSHTPLWKKITAGATSGAVGSVIANPTDLVKVRLQAQGKLEPGTELRHSGVFSAFSDIIKHQGVRGLWTGCGPTVCRAMILTATQIPTYDHVKHTLLNHAIMEEGVPLHIVSSMAAGLMCAITTSPVDTIKTRIMNQHMIDGVGAKYRSPVDAFFQCIRAEGLFGLYKGFFPNWLRLGPHTIITFFIFERLRSLAGIRPV
ncbi:mitochondrial substrate carrier family protein ucpB-like [Watersipora subatra]|uniref:mitochondrial substrate carrier family protein ucpB-like n=1 Tax=Watersipora subatra TaxID=2589382 RepID=UPI00355BF88C